MKKLIFSYIIIIMVNASQNVKEQWKNRVIAEYCSAAISAELLHWSIQLGLSPDIVWKTQQVTREEITHSELSNQVYDFACNGDAPPPNINPKSLKINHAQQAPLMFRAATFAADFFCIGECLGHPLFKKMLEDCTVTQAKKALEIICQDEKSHGEFGFEFLNEVLPRLQKDEVAELKKNIATYLERYRKIYDTQFAVTSDERAWGLISGPEHQEIVLDKIEKLVKPNFQAILGAL